MLRQSLHFRFSACRFHKEEGGHGVAPISACLYAQHCKHLTKWGSQASPAALCWALRAGPSSPLMVLMRHMPLRSDALLFFLCSSCFLPLNYPQHSVHIMWNITDPFFNIKKRILNYTMGTQAPSKEFKRTRHLFFVLHFSICRGQEERR